MARFLMLLSCTFLFSYAAVAATPRQPNIIFIMADDLGYGDLGCYGQEKIRTPQIDRLAAEGMRFTQFYSGSTVCAPARSVLMTGLHTGHTWIRGNASRRDEQRVALRPEDVTVAEVLKNAGYTTGIVGKWGLGEPDTTGIPNRKGFDYWFGYLNQRHAHSYYPEYLWRNQEKVVLEGNLDGKQEIYSHDLMTGEALQFIERSKDQPFFLYVAYTIPHSKLEVPSDEPYTDKDWPQPQKNLAAMITRMDADVGRIMERLKALGLDNDTIVFFTSDNGPHAEGGGDSNFFGSSGPLRGIKRDLYEGGIRVPMIARWPGRIAPGTVSDHVWAMWDFMPTAAALAGTRSPESIDGLSVVPALLGRSGAQQTHEFMYWEFHERGFHQAVRMSDWKTVRSRQRPLELYNLRDDPGEQNNVAAEHPEVVARIESYLKTARTESEHWPIR